MATGDVDALASDALAALSRRRLGLATAESLTGGMLGTIVTAVPGASTVYLGGVVAYAVEVKERVLGVPAAVVEEHGVVSRECAEAMATGVRRVMGAGAGLATTGVAGPGPEDGIAAGTVWVAADVDGRVVARRLELTGDRAEVRRGTCAAVLELLLTEIQPTA